jgi:hypothetical protein
VAIARSLINAPAVLLDGRNASDTLSGRDIES